MLKKLTFVKSINIEGFGRQYALKKNELNCG